MTLTLLTTALLLGEGNGIVEECEGTNTNRSLRRFQLCRAATNPFQLAIAWSTGARARPARIEPAIIIPALACCWRTKYAPIASTPDCSIIRNTLDVAPK